VIKEESDLGSISLDGLKQIIDDRLVSLELVSAKDGVVQQYRMLNLVPGGALGELSIIDAKKGQVVGTISPGGVLVSAPVVHDNVASFAIQMSEGGEVQGQVWDLDAQRRMHSFRVGTEGAPDYTLMQVMGREDEARYKPDEEDAVAREIEDMYADTPEQPKLDVPEPAAAPAPAGDEIEQPVIPQPAGPGEQERQRGLTQSEVEGLLKTRDEKEQMKKSTAKRPKKKTKRPSSEDPPLG
jgi:hypothetical protein